MKLFKESPIPMVSTISCSFGQSSLLHSLIFHVFKANDLKVFLILFNCRRQKYWLGTSSSGVQFPITSELLLFWNWKFILKVHFFRLIRSGTRWLWWGTTILPLVYHRYVLVPYIWSFFISYTLNSVVLHLRWYENGVYLLISSKECIIFNWNCNKSYCRNHIYFKKQ